MSGRKSDLVALVRADRRYPLEAYEFLCHALAFTQRMVKEENSLVDEDTEGVLHVSGQKLLEGIRQFAIEQFGMMAYVVFQVWGIRSTNDFGTMVYKLIESGLWHKSPQDRIDDFNDLYDFETVFVQDYRIKWDET